MVYTLPNAMFLYHSCLALEHKGFFVCFEVSFF